MGEFEEHVGRKIAKLEAERDALIERERIVTEMVRTAVQERDAIRELAGELVHAAERAMLCYTIKMVDEHDAIYERAGCASEVRAALAKARELGVTK